MGSIRGRALKGGGLFLFLFVLLFSFTLNLAHAYPAPKFQEIAAVFSYHAADGSTKTIFVSTISGPSPEDVTSFTVTGPSGTFDLTSSLSTREKGLYYRYIEGGLINDGSYTFQLTDSVRALSRYSIATSISGGGSELYLTS